jgi:hypothetical protein
MKEKKKKIEQKKIKEKQETKTGDLRDLKGKTKFSANYDYKAMRLYRFLD